MVDLNQNCAEIMCSDIPNFVTNVEWYETPIANVIISCVQSYGRDTEWPQCS
jgi:hypothetical protein